VTAEQRSDWEEISPTIRRMVGAMIERLSTELTEEEPLTPREASGNLEP
jgi:hypothetical protein